MSNIRSLSFAGGLVAAAAAGAVIGSSFDGAAADCCERAPIQLREPPGTVRVELNDNDGKCNGARWDVDARGEKRGAEFAVDCSALRAFDLPQGAATRVVLERSPKDLSCWADVFAGGKGAVAIVEDCALLAATADDPSAARAREWIDVPAPEPASDAGPQS